MIHFKEPGSDMFEGNHQCLINTVNTTGVMGAGIAKIMKEKYPVPCNIFNYNCKVFDLKGGTVLVYESYVIPNPKYIMMFATKQEVRYPAQYSYIEKGLISMVEKIREYNIIDIAIPALGTGYGGLEWSIVKPMIIKTISSIENECELFIYEPW